MTQRRNPVPAEQHPDTPSLPDHDDASHQQLRVILAALQDGVILIEPDQTISWANEAALRMHGVDKVKALGGSVSEYRQHFELRYRNRHRLPQGDYPMERVLAGEAFDEVVVDVAPRGEEKARWTHRIRSLVLTNNAGAPDCLVLILNDETARFDAEERFETTFAANPAPAVILRLSDHRFIKVNRGFLDMTGYQEQDVLGRSAYEIDVLEEAARREFAIERLQQGRTIPQMEAVLQLPAGGEKQVIVAGQPIEVSDTSCMLFTFVDLSGRQKAEDERRKSEANFATLMRITPDPVLVITQAGHLVRQANTAFLRTTGLAEAELSGKMLGALPIWEDDAAGCELEAKLQEQDELQPCRVTLRGRDGRAVQHRISTAAIQLGDEACLLLVAQDVAEQSRTEAEIVAAIEAVMKDTAWFMQAVREKMAITRRPPSTDTVEIDKISRRVRQVLDLVCGGLADAEIARELHISRNTVRNHVMSLYRITGVHSRTGLVIWAHERGITSVTAEKPKDPPGS